jgi:hypothetical protein
MHVADRVVSNDASKTNHQELVIVRLLRIVLIARWYGNQVHAIVGATDIARLGK